MVYPAIGLIEASQDLPTAFLKGCIQHPFEDPLIEPTKEDYGDKPNSSKLAVHAQLGSGVLLSSCSKEFRGLLLGICGDCPSCICRDGEAHSGTAWHSLPASGAAGGASVGAGRATSRER